MKLPETACVGRIMVVASGTLKNKKINQRLSMEHIPLFFQNGRTGLWFGTVALSLAIYSVRSQLRNRLHALAAGVVPVKL